MFRLLRAILLVLGVLSLVWLQIWASIGLRGDTDGASYRDFGSFWAAGDAANRGQNPYAAYPLTRTVPTPMGDQPAVNLNPPVSVLVFQLLARVEPTPAFRAWQVGSLVLYAVVVLVLLRTFPGRDGWWRGLLLLAWQPLWSTLDLGQLYVVLLVFAAVGFIALRRHPVLGGIAIGLLVALKPQFAVWPALLLAARHRRPAATALLVALAASLLPIALGHGDWYEQWATAVQQTDFLNLADNLSLLSVLTRHGVSEAVALALIAAALVGLWMTIAARPSAARRISGIALAAAILAGPVTWIGYAAVLAPVVLSRSDWSEPILWAVIMLAVPGVLLWWFHAGYLIYDAALVLMLGTLLLEPSSRSSSRAADLEVVTQAGDAIFPNSRIGGS